MTIDNANTELDKLLAATANKSDRKRIIEFKQILSYLENHEFSKKEQNGIDQELNQLINSLLTKKKSIKNVLNLFKKYLSDTFSFVTKGHYRNLGIGLGSSFGMLAGLVLLSNFERSIGVAIGIIAGMFIGLIVGQTLDANAQKNGKVISSPNGAP